MITFTERGSRDVNGLGFGGKFSLENSVEVIAIKTDRDLWYENFTDALVKNLLKYLNDIRGEYQSITCYGGSMGGYAAMKFAKPLLVNNVLAFSPVFNIFEPWEKRWSEDKLFLSKKMFCDNDYSDKVRYFVVYDPCHNEDALHYQSFQEVLWGSLTGLPISFSGHPVGPYLKETGVLKSLVLGVIKDSSFPEVALNHKLLRRKSPVFFFNLGKYLIKKNKFKSAKLMNKRLFLSDSLNPEYYIQRAKIKNNFVDFKGGMDDCDLAIEKRPNNQNYIAYKEHLKKKWLKYE